MKFSLIEQEAIILNAVMGMVDDMVNHSIFCGLGEKRHDTNLLPQTSETLRQFNILLRDFLSPVTARGNDPMPFELPKPPNNKVQTDHTSLYYLRHVCEQPLIGSRVAPLKMIVDSFIEWLEAEAFVEKVWFARISLETNLRIKRIDFIRMTGDIGKHNFLRLGGQAAKLRRILADNGKQITEDEAYLALPDCWDWFHTHLFAYHASTIAEFLNNIRYTIRLYVKPVAKERYRETGRMLGDIHIYTYERPEEIVSEFAWSSYYDLLDSSRYKPNFPPFSVSKNLKKAF
ncbi:hypothetical protein EQZ23_08470 [Sphingomonas sp. UV9]|uniref:hypothetical protein n=1 Tax=Sphingomonas sp. UV9 TaxID=1851410 RepID=UPI000FFBD0C1|nr:hypothetical protein [Sphingomonas sp. UV9]RXD05140.1 hypothetical protein EQZ23_08470 [Sphingomonas sp. UV9]